jgi:phage terminase large subunit-like protein
MKDEFEKYKTYANAVLTGKVVACKYIIKACQRYLNLFDRDELYFSPNKVEKVVDFISHLRHYAGKSNGKKFILEDWQKWIIYSIYGFYKRENDKRLITNVFVLVARKNGKTALVAAICLYELIAGESGGQILLCANSRRQAHLCFDMCNYFTSTLQNAKKHFKQLRDTIKFSSKKSYLQTMSSEASRLDGYSASVGVFDEYHEFRDEKLYNVIKSSMGFRLNPLSIIISTAGLNQDSVCKKKYDISLEILDNIKQDDSQFIAIYQLDDEDNYEDEKCWIKANPNLGITVEKDFLESQIQEAKNDPSKVFNLQTKLFNRWMSSSEVWIDNKYVRSATAKIDLNKYAGNFAYLGVDLSAVNDITAVSLMTLDGEKYVFKSWYFLPESCLQNNVNSEMYKDWQRQGLLEITKGEAVNYDEVLALIKRINSKVQIYKIAYDTWNSTQFNQTAISEGLPMYPFSQKIGNFNRPTKEFERLIYQNKVIIDDNQITRWMLNNVELMVDSNENEKPAKGKDRSRKIDGVISMLEALGTYITDAKYTNEIYSLN